MGSLCSWRALTTTTLPPACLPAGEEPQDGQPEKHSSVYYMVIYAAISGAQLVMLQINFTCVVTFGIRAGR